MFDRQFDEPSAGIGSGHVINGVGCEPGPTAHCNHRIAGQ
jgi:hypothetical protein